MKYYRLGVNVFITQNTYDRIVMKDTFAEY